MKKSLPRTKFEPWTKVRQASALTVRLSRSEVLLYVLLMKDNNTQIIFLRNSCLMLIYDKR